MASCRRPYHRHWWCISTAVTCLPGSLRQESSASQSRAATLQRQAHRLFEGSHDGSTWARKFRPQFRLIAMFSERSFSSWWVGTTRFMMDSHWISEFWAGISQQAHVLVYRSGFLSIEEISYASIECIIREIG